jgi:putative endonuclease
MKGASYATLSAAAVILSVAKDLVPVVSSSKYYVYIMASRSRVLYCGVTNDLIRRVYQHKSGAIAGFSRKYRVKQLVYFEQTPNSRAAVAREREIKGWVREKKCRLIESANSGWLDLASSWFPELPG